MLPLDRFLAFMGAAGVGIAFMEPRAFWFGFWLCLSIAAIAIYDHFTEAKQFCQKWIKYRSSTRRRRPKITANLIYGAGIILFCTIVPGILFFTRSIPVLDYGTLSNSWYAQTINYLSGTRPLIQIGESGAFFSASEKESYLTPFIKRDQLSVRSSRTGLKVSTKILDQADNIIAVIRDNEWKVAGIAWDKNYNDNAFEVIDSYGNVALQIKLLSDRIQIQGFWWADLGPPNGVRRIVVRKSPTGMDGQFVILPKDKSEADPDFPRIETLFEYPSGLHPGELKRR